ncbi:14007_t:CDS:10 [Racocetra fulgida]|uniref:14007_t:CDS:1 n=1 Tax=Racocetra fulgida TaxID=60492 RepID=A0A9N8YWH9_9GLOM|nr:14007_t:CDS:10 [Racocetra fulgida]
MKDQFADAYLSSFRKKDKDGIDSALARGATLNDLFENLPDDPLLKKPYLNLFSVYKNEDIWEAKPRQVGVDPHEDSLYIMPLPDEKRRKKGELSICKGGGSVFACLLPLPAKDQNNPYKIRKHYNETFASSDIDIHFYGIDEEAAKKKMLHIYETVCRNVPFKVICVHCCGSCPQAQTPDEIKLQEENDRYYINGELKFIKNHFDPMDPGIKNTQDEWTADAYIMEPRENLCIAATKGDAIWIQQIIQEHGKDLDLNARDQFGKTPLQLAILGGHLAAVKQLIENDAKITIRMLDGLGPLHLAAKSGNLDIIEELLKKNAQNEKLKEQDEINKESSVSNDTENDDNESDDSLDIIDPNELDDAMQNSWNHSFSPLEYAIIFGHVDVVKRLIQAGANVRRHPKATRILNFLNMDRQSPVTIAVKNGNREMLELLLKYGAHASITLEDFNELNKYQKAYYKYEEDIEQPVLLSLENGLSRLLIEAGVHVNSLFYNSKETLLDRVVKLINDNVKNLPDFKISDTIERQINATHIKSLISSELKKHPVDSYVGYLLSRIDESQMNDTIFKLTPLNSICDKIDEKEPKNRELLEKLRQLDECFVYLYERGAQISLEFEVNQHAILGKLEELKTKEDLLAKKRKHLELINTHKLQETTETNIQLIKAILETQIEILNQIVEHQNKFFAQRIPSSQQIINILKKSSKDLIKDTKNPTSDDIYKNIISFKYLNGSFVPESIYEQYTNLYQALWDNNTELVESLSSDLIIAVQDKNGMTPFMLACYKGYENLAIQILKIAERQYLPKDSNDQDPNKNKTFINNYDLLETYSDYSNDYDSEDEAAPEIPAETVIDEVQDTKPAVHIEITALQLLRQTGYYLSAKYELLQMKCKKQFIQGSFNGLALAAFMNHVKVIKEVLTWAETYQKVKEDMTNLVMQLIRNTNTYAPLTTYNYNNLMQCAMFADNVDVVDLLIESYIGLNINGKKKRSWISRHNPYILQQAVDPSFLHMAAHYGATKTIEYFLSLRPIEALQRFSSLHCKNSNIKNILLTDQEILKVGRVLFWFYLPKADTPFHWAVKMNKPESIKELANIYKGFKKDDDEPLEQIINQESFDRYVTPFLLAVIEDKIECAEALLEIGADPSIPDEFEWTALHHAAYQGNLKMLRFLFDKLDRNITQTMLETQTIDYKHTPISIAILEGRKDTFQFLLERTTNTSIVDFAHNNYLHLSVKESSLGITKILLSLEDHEKKSGEKSSALNYLCCENTSGQTPIDIAVNQFLKEIHDTNTLSDGYIKKPKDQRYVSNRSSYVALQRYISRQSISRCSKQEEIEYYQPFEVFDLLQKATENINSRKDLISFKDAKDMIYKGIDIWRVLENYFVDKEVYAIPEVKIYICNFIDDYTKSVW